jgi:hypothetical protein
MEHNVGTVDKTIRFIIAIVFIIMGITLSPWWFIVAAIALVTALMGYCGLYSVCNINTNDKKSVKSNTRPAKKKPKKR